jgi:hypothetical protein
LGCPRPRNEKPGAVFPPGLLYTNFSLHFLA